MVFNKRNLESSVVSERGEGEQWRRAGGGWGMPGWGQGGLVAGYYQFCWEGGGGLVILLLPVS